MTLSSPSQIDENIPRFNQAMVAVLTGLAFVLQWWPLVAVVLAVVAVTRFAGHGFGLFTQAYVRLIRPRLRGPIRTEPAAPPRFSQTLAVLFLATSTGLLAAGATVAGWAVALVVFALAALAAAGFSCSRRRSASSGRQSPSWSDDPRGGAATPRG
jgi:hypothetical protein